LANLEPVRLLNLGRALYPHAHARQLELHAARRRGEISDTLMLTEHEPVITTGRGSDFRHLRVDRERLAKLGIDILQVERGGDITYHGPGQLIAYPILDLRGFGRDVHQYVRRLEESAKLFLGRVGVEAGRRAGQPGLYASGGKIASVGVFISGWVTMHGIAINLSLPAEHAGLVRPCGLYGTEYTSVELLTGRVTGVDESGHAYLDAFEQVFGRRLVDAGPS
jgi:lipoyl(octanoyl) transferase